MEKDHTIDPIFANENQSESASPETTENNADLLLHKAIEHNQVILLLAELLKQRAWEDNKNYVAAVKDLDAIISQVRESSALLQKARKSMAVQPVHRIPRKAKK
jgi:hypothetical protein